MKATEKHLKDIDGILKTERTFRLHAQTHRAHASQGRQYGQGPHNKYLTFLYRTTAVVNHCGQE